MCNTKLCSSNGYDIVRKKKIKNVRDGDGERDPLHDAAEGVCYGPPPD